MEEDHEQPSTRGAGAPADAADLDPEERPGVPMEAAPRPMEDAHRTTPASQAGREDRLTRAGTERATPVFGTAQPPRGLSGRIRRLAYRLPEHRARHWMLLLAADRVDVAEDRLGGPLGRPLEALGREGAARRVRSDPLTVLAGIGAGILLARAVFGIFGPGRSR